MAANSGTDATQVRIASGLTFAIGLWLFLAGFWYGDPAQIATPWNNALLGLVVALMAGYRLARPDRFVGLSHMNIVLGLWLAVSPFVLGYSDVAGPAWTDIVLGLAIAALSAWSAWATGSAESPSRR